MPEVRQSNSQLWEEITAMTKSNITRLKTAMKERKQIDAFRKRQQQQQQQRQKAVVVKS
jgi:hypothetical protein